MVSLFGLPLFAALRLGTLALNNLVEGGSRFRQGSAAQNCPQILPIAYGCETSGKTLTRVSSIGYILPVIEREIKKLEL